MHDHFNQLAAYPLVISHQLGHVGHPAERHLEILNPSAAPLGIVLQADTLINTLMRLIPQRDRALILLL
jgi:hypothetical protein